MLLQKYFNEIIEIESRFLEKPEVIMHNTKTPIQFNPIFINSVEGDAVGACIDEILRDLSRIKNGVDKQFHCPHPGSKHICIECSLFTQPT